MELEKTCKKCGVLKTIWEFPQRKKKSDYACNACMREAARATEVKRWGKSDKRSDWMCPWRRANR